MNLHSSLMVFIVLFLFVHLCGSDIISVCVFYGLWVVSRTYGGHDYRSFSKHSLAVIVSSLNLYEYQQLAGDWTSLAAFAYYICDALVSLNL